MVELRCVPFCVDNFSYFVDIFCNNFLTRPKKSLHVNTDINLQSFFPFCILQGDRKGRPYL